MYQLWLHSQRPLIWKSIPKTREREKCLFMRKPHELHGDDNLMDAMMKWTWIGWMIWRCLDAICVQRRAIAISLESEKQKEVMKQEVESNWKILFFHLKKQVKWAILE